jgi:hypothetical protein
MELSLLSERGWNILYIVIAIVIIVGIILLVWYLVKKSNDQYISPNQAEIGLGQSIANT